VAGAAAASGAACAPTSEPTAAGDWPALRARRRRWAQLLRRVFEVEVTVCPDCGGAMRILTFITAAAPVRRILAHVKERGIDARAGPWAAAAVSG